MSRTVHHRRQKRVHAGFDYGARYNCDKGYAAGYGPVPKDMARRERRNAGKRLIMDEVHAVVRGD